MNQLISASAGSGKTHALTTQYLRLLRARHLEVLSGTETTLRVESLLATTFTRKAAGEIFDRILKRLAGAALHDEGLEKLRDELKDETLTKEICQDLLLHLCRSLHRVQVGTLDSFFQRLCQVYRQEAGLSGDMRMTDSKSPHCLALQKEALQSMLKDMDDPDEAGALFQKLTRQKASSSIVPKILSMLQDVSESVTGAQHHHWEQLLVPDRPALERIDAALENLDDYLLTLTGLRWPAAVSGDLERFRGQQWEKFLTGGLVKPCLAETNTYHNVPIPEERVRDYQVLLAVAKHELLKELKERTLAIRDVHEAFSRKFKERLRREGYVLFSETPVLLTELIGDMVQTGRRLDGSLEHLLLDEFQDTSDPQWGLLKGFALQASLAPGSVFVVGDAKQAIYGWRGGRAEIFEQFGNDIQLLEKGTLEKSYRSSEVILNVVNDVFQKISSNAALEEHTQAAAQWEEYFKEHLAAKTLPGFVEFCVSPVPADPNIVAAGDGDGQPGDGDGDDGADWNAAGASHHLARCAERIAEKIGKLPPGHSVGVLVRSNKTLAQMVDLLRAKRVPVSGEGLGKIADDPAVELMLSGLLLADHPGHTAAAYHVAHSPLGESLGLTAAFGLEGRMGGDGMDADKVALIASGIRRKILSGGYAGILTEWATVLAPFGMERTGRRLEQILELAAGFDALPPMRPSSFVRAVRESSVENPGAAAVRVMTINRAKGLEFDVVFLPDLEWKTRVSDQTCLVKRASVGAISGGASPVEAVYARPNAVVQQLDPDLSALGEIAAAEEVTGMLCLLYVAMTRPKMELHLYVAPHRINAGGAPASPGLKPAAILRAALCGSARHPDQGSDWTTLKKWGQPLQRTDDKVLERTASPPPRPPLRFGHSDGTRRGSLPNAASERSIPAMANDVLRLRNN